MKKLMLIVSMALFVQNASAFPYRFTRLIKTDATGKIEKTVDLIHDMHVKIPQPTKKTPRVTTQGISPEQWTALSIVERSLLRTFRKLAEQPGEPIDLIWEWAQKYKLSGYATSNLMHGDASLFLWDMGKTFENEFDELKKRRIKFVLGDTYRRDILVPLSQIISYVVFQKDSQGKYVSDINSSLNGMIEKANIDLQKVKPTISIEIYNKISDYLKYVEKEISNFIIRYDITSKSNVEIAVWLQKYSASKSSLIDDLSHIAIIVMNLELLMRVFGSSSSHNIIYAGGNHCVGLMEELVDYYNFKKVIDVGIIDTLDSNFYISLVPSAWNYLQETPDNSLRKGKYISLMEQKDYQNIVQDIKTDSFGVFHASIIKSIRAHADLINAISIDERGSLLAYAVIYDNQRCIDLLLHYAALTNIKDIHGNTPIFYAKSAETVQKLIKHGAKLNIRNNNAETPLFFALVMESDIEVIRALLEAGANPNDAGKISEDMTLKPLDLAAMSENNEIVKLLQQYGATRMRRHLDPMTKIRLDDYIASVKGLFQENSTEIK